MQLVRKNVGRKKLDEAQVVNKPCQAASKRNLECCRCNDNGLCLRCRCVKSNTCCVSCLPLKRGHCQNDRPDLAQAIWPTDAGSVSVNLRSSGIPTAARPNPSTPLPLASSPPRVANPFSAASNHAPNVSSFTPSLPFPAPAAEPNFVWGTLDANSFQKIITKAYEEVVHWQKKFLSRALRSLWKVFCFRAR